MPDYYTKVIPADPFQAPEEKRLHQAADYLLDKLRAMEATVDTKESPVFVDCGGLLEEVRCPFCGADVFDWWIKEMDARYDGTGFPDLRAVLPCCGRETTLDKLDYQAPCGFARTEIRLLYPRAQPEEEHLEQAREILGVPVRVIRSRI